MTAGATFNAEVTDVGSSSVDERGFVWDTTSHGGPGDTAPSSSAYASSWTETGTFSTGTYIHDETTLSENTTYYYRGVAHNGDGWGYGDEVSFTTPELAAPTVSFSDTTTEDELSVSWTDVSNEDGYRALISSSSGSTASDYVVDADLAAGTTSHTFTGLPDGRRRFVRIEAYTSGGSTELSNEIDAVTVLPAPTDLSVDAVTGDKFEVSMVDNADSKDGYRFYTGPDGYLEFNRANSEEVIVPHDSTVEPDRYAIYVEVNIPDVSIDQGIVSKRQANISSPYVVYILNGQVNLDANINGNWHSALVSAPSDINRVVAYYDGSEIGVNVDGTTDADTNPSGGTPTGNGDDVSIGNEPGRSDTGYLDGDVERLAMFGTSPTQSEIDNFINNGQMPSGGDPRMWYEFNQGSGSTLTDYSGNGNDGTLQNSPTWHGGGALTQDGEVTSTVSAGSTVTYTTTNLLDGERYVIRGSTFTTETEVYDH